MENIPLSLDLAFIGTTLLTFYFFYKVVNKSSQYGHLSNKICTVLITWMIVQYLIAKSGFYIENTETTPPPFLLVFGPVLIFIVYLFNSKKGKKYIDSLPMYESTLLHVVRIPVELVLYALALHKTIPELMTFAGRNFDILAGITAPFVAFIGIKKQRFNKAVLLLWNVFCLALLLFIVINALLSAPFNFQQFAFKQPNIAVLHSPYVLLPAFIVPVVLFCHLVAIRQLTKK